MKRTTLVFALTILTIALTPALTIAQTSEGYSLLQKGWVNDAIGAFQSALKKNTQNKSARLGFANSFKKAGRLGEAWNNYQMLLKVDGQNLEALKAIGKLGEYRSNWQLDGISALNQLLRLKPNDRSALAQRALLLGYQGEFGSALTDYDLLLSSNGINPEVLLGAAKINTYAGNYATARKLFEQANSAGKTLDDYALAAYATALTQTGSAPDAIASVTERLRSPKLEANAETDLRKALAITLASTGKVEMGLQILNSAKVNPLAIAQGYAEIARRTDRSDLYDKAISRYQDLLKTSPTRSLTIEAADVMSERVTTQPEALKLYDSVADQFDPNHPVQFKRLMLGYRLGLRSATEVEQNLEAILANSPLSKKQQQDALRGLAEVRIRGQKFDTALVAYDRILAIDPQDGRAKLGRTRIAVVSRKITVAEAETVLNQWLTENPTVTPPPELFDLVGALPADESRTKLYDRLLAINSNSLDLQRRSLQLLAKQDPNIARTQLAAYMNRAKGDVNAYYLQGEVARTLGDLELAASGYQAILNVQPENVDALTALGGVRFEQKNYPLAFQIYSRAIVLRPNDWNLRRTIADLSLAQDKSLLALEQLKIVQALQREQGIKDDETDYRIMAIEVDRLKRRSFQPSWEGYTPSK